MKKAIKKKLLCIPLTLALVLGFSCGGDDEEDFNIDSCSLNGPNFSISEVSGSWVATRAVFDIPGTSVVFDVIAEGGGVSLDVEPDGNFIINIFQPGERTEAISGTMGFCNNVFTVLYSDAPDEPEAFAASLNAGTFSINGATFYDVDGNGTEDDAFVVLQFVRP